MKFVDSVKAFLAENPDDVMDIPSALGCAVVDIETHDERRWYNIKHAVFQLKTPTRNINNHLIGFEDEYVLVEYCEPATELQEGGDFPEPEVFAVEPYVVEVVKYRPV